MVRTLQAFSSIKQLIAKDRPIHAVGLLLFATGLTLIYVCRSFPNLWRLHQGSYGGTNLPLEEIPSLPLDTKVFKGSLGTNHVPPTNRKVLWALLFGGVDPWWCELNFFEEY
jgi:hypothetical protein